MVPVLKTTIPQSQTLWCFWYWSQTLWCFWYRTGVRLFGVSGTGVRLFGVSVTVLELDSGVSGTVLELDCCVKDRAKSLTLGRLNDIENNNFKIFKVTVK